MDPASSNRTKFAWVGLFYFAEGLPFGVLFEAFPVYMRAAGSSLQEIGFVSLMGLAWAGKFLWAPAVDLWGCKRAWIVVTQGLLAINLLYLSFVNPAGIAQGYWLGLVSLAVLAATHDVAIDGYTIEFLDKADMGPANGIRVTTYRLALIVTGGLSVAVAGYIGWWAAFVTISGFLAVLSVVSTQLPKRDREDTDAGIREISGGALLQAYREPFRTLGARKGFFAVFLFVLLFKFGDMAMGPMIRPFWVDRGFSPTEIGMVPGTLGVFATVTGALLGGRLTKQLGLFRALWVLGITQVLSNLFYAFVAFLPRSENLMYGASAVESFCGGLGTAPFLTFLMTICDRRHSATQFALMSATIGIGRALSGAVSGVIAGSVGYALYFMLTVLLALPAFLLLPWVAEWIRVSADSRCRK